MTIHSARGACYGTLQLLKWCTRKISVMDFVDAVIVAGGPTSDLIEDAEIAAWVASWLAQYPERLRDSDLTRLSKDEGWIFVSALMTALVKIHAKANKWKDSADEKEGLLGVERYRHGLLAEQVRKMKRRKFKTGRTTE